MVVSLLLISYAEKMGIRRTCILTCWLDLKFFYADAVFVVGVCCFQYRIVISFSVFRYAVSRYRVAEHVTDSRGGNPRPSSLPILVQSGKPVAVRRDTELPPVTL